MNPFFDYEQRTIFSIMNNEPFSRLWIANFMNNEPLLSSIFMNNEPYEQWTIFIIYFLWITNLMNNEPYFCRSSCYVNKDPYVNRMNDERYEYRAVPNQGALSH